MDILQRAREIYEGDTKGIIIVHEFLPDGNIINDFVASRFPRSSFRQILCYQRLIQSSEGAAIAQALYQSYYENGEFPERQVLVEEGVLK